MTQKNSSEWKFNTKVGNCKYDELTTAKVQERYARGDTINGIASSMRIPRPTVVYMLQRKVNGCEKLAICSKQRCLDCVNHSNYEKGAAVHCGNCAHKKEVSLCLSCSNHELFSIGGD